SKGVISEGELRGYHEDGFFFLRKAEKLTSVDFLNCAKCGFVLGQLCAYDCYVNIMWFDLHASRCTAIAPAGRLLGAYDLGVATSRAVVHAGDKTSGDARSWYMTSGDANSWVVIVLHIFTVILHNCPLFEILAQRLGFLQTYELTNIIVDVFEYHFQVCFDKGKWMVLEIKDVHPWEFRI
ncbi:hypothetical protein Tco_1341272, partial [Tanacetum coccineum]